MPERDDFSTTMRIDITAHMPETVELLKKNGKLLSAKPVKGSGRKSAHSETRRLLRGSDDFEELLQNLYDGAIVTHMDGRIISANIRALSFFGFGKSELSDRNVLDIIIGADASLLRTIVDNLTNNQFTLIQAFCERKDKSVFPAEISVNRMKLSGVDVLNFFIRDITLRREAEEQLRTGFNAIQNSGNGIAIADLNANFVYLNAAIRQLWGLAADDAMSNRNIREFMTDQDKTDEILETIQRNDVWRGELRMQRSDSSYVFVNASVAPNCNADEELTGMVISLLDISEQKAAREQLEKYARELSDRNRQMEEDLVMAREIQEALLPRDYPCGDADRFKLAHVYYPSGAVGGDFFDVFRISDAEIGVFLCDVMGHGMRAALVVATIRGLLEQLKGGANDPGQFLTDMNNAYNGVFQKMRDVTFATTFYCVVNTKSGEVRYVDAGHPAPFILHRGEGLVEQVDISDVKGKGPAIGLFEEVTYRQGCFSLKPQDMLMLYTDGLGEELNEQDEYYETKRLAEFLAAHAKDEPEQLLQGIARDALMFSGKSEFSDDVCLFAVALD
jgi:sigma-B regulation protein RsbU (phosphoserine phosphatase)